MYRWMVYAHIAGVLGFFMMQGGVLSVLLRLKHERDAERIASLLSLQGLASRWSIPPLVIISLSGIILGYLGRWWTDAWIWVSMALLALMGISGFGISMAASRRIRASLRVEVGNPSVTTSFLQDLKPEQIEPLSSTWPAYSMAVINGGGLMLLLWLMIFKPF